MSKPFNINVMPDTVRDALKTVVEDHKEEKLSMSGALLFLAGVGYEKLYGKKLEDAIPQRGGYRLRKEDQEKLDKLKAIEEAETN